MASLMQLLSLRAVSSPSLPPAWTGVACHTHLVRNPKAGDDVSRANLLAWTRANHVGAVGLGSPWTSRSAATYRRFETVERDRYFAGLVDPASVMDRDDILEMIRAVNEAARGETLFYLDNETPKMRYGHLWHVGFDYQVPAWHDYDQDRHVSYSELDPVADPNPLAPGGAHLRRTYMEVVARQRQAGAICVWAHPTSWWHGDSQGGSFVTNIASDMLPELFADGRLDGLTVQGYDAYHRAYQALWFALLDRGWRIPGFAELDLSPGHGASSEKGHILLNVLHGISGAPTMDEILSAFRAARHGISSGPYLRLEADGLPTGSELAPGVRHVRVTACPAEDERALGRVELLGPGGAVLAHLDDFPGGTAEFDVEASAGDWLLARAFGEHDGDYASKPQQQVRHCALTNPVFFGPDRSAPVRTTLTLEPGDFAGAPMRIVTAAGETLLRGTVPTAPTVYVLPASARLEVARPDGRVRTLPLSMVNPRVRARMDYLADGRFLADFPDCRPGEVPFEAFRYDEMREAIASLTLRL